jgi:hypothetical protein
MINALHLLWIVPVSGVIGYFTAALAYVSKDDKS